MKNKRITTALIILLSNLPSICTADTNAENNGPITPPVSGLLSCCSGTIFNKSDHTITIKIDADGYITTVNPQGSATLSYTSLKPVPHSLYVSTPEGSAIRPINKYANQTFYVYVNSDGVPTIN